MYVFVYLKLRSHCNRAAAHGFKIVKIACVKDIVFYKHASLS